jgi:hypothetical protein
MYFIFSIWYGFQIIVEELCKYVLYNVFCVEFVNGKIVLSLLDRLDRSGISMFNKGDKGVARQNKWVD